MNRGCASSPSFRMQASPVLPVERAIQLLRENIMSMSRIACKTVRLLAPLLVSLVMASCGGGGGGGVVAVPVAKTWTILVYMDGDNNLSGSALANFTQMQAATGSTNVTVVVQLATLGASTKRYQIKNGATTLLADLGEVNMATGQSITNFLTWATTAYPADRTVLILWDHGDGWDELTPRAAAAGAPAAPHSLAMFTNPGSNTPVLFNYQIRQAIEQSGIKLDVLGFDGCNMGTLEAFYEFRGLAGVLVASEELVPDNGWNYNALLSGLAAAPGMSAEDFGTLAVTAYQNYYANTQPPLTATTLIALRGLPSSGLDQDNPITRIAVEIDSVARQLQASLASPATSAATLSTITQARAGVQEIDISTSFVYVDLVDLFNRLGVATALPALVSAATIAEYHGSARPGAHGISIVFFKLPEAITYNVYDPNYKNYDAATNTGNQGAFINSFQWDEFLHAYYVDAGLL